MAEIRDEVYPRRIRILHWTVLALVLVQLLSADFMSAFFRRAQDLPLGTLPDNFGAYIHALGGATILVLMIIRFISRLKLGTPPKPRDLSPPLRLLASLNHFAFYVVLVLLPLTGVSALFFARDFGDVHEALKNVLYVLIGLHVAGIVYHMFILRDGVLWRMIRVGR